MWNMCIDIYIYIHILILILMFILYSLFSLTMWLFSFTVGLIVATTSICTNVSMCIYNHIYILHYITKSLVHMYLWHVCVCADLKNLNVEQFGNGESRCWCTRWIPCSGHILFGSQIAWSPAGTSPKKIEKENPSKIDINMMVLSVWGLWGLRWIPARIKRIQTAIQQKNAEKNIKDVWKVGFTCQLLSPIPAQALVKGWRTFLRMPRVPASNSRLSKPFPNRPRLSWSPQQTLPTSPFTGGKMGKGHGPKDLALHQLHLAPRLSVTIVHQVEQGRALLNQARAAKREESSLTLHGR